MSYYINDKVVRTLPEQVAQNQEDIAALQDAQKTDESNINTNLNNINAHETRINALESLKMTQDGQNIKLTKSTGEIGNIAVGTVGGTNLLGGNDVTFKTINGETITGEGNLTVDTDLSSLLWANLGIGRWRNQKFSAWVYGNTIDDPLLPLYTNCSYCFAGVQYYLANEDWSVAPYFAKDVKMQSGQYISSNLCNGIFKRFDNGGGALTVDIRCTGNCEQGFCEATMKSITFTNPSLFAPSAMSQGFMNCYNLVDIGEFSAKNLKYNSNIFIGCTKLKSIHITNLEISFDISASTAFEEADLVEIIGNLDPVSTTQTLTMGSTNLAKLTIDDILIATGKGWQLA